MYRFNCLFYHYDKEHAKEVWHRAYHAARKMRRDCEYRNCTLSILRRPGKTLSLTLSSIWQHSENELYIYYYPC